MINGGSLCDCACHNVHRRCTEWWIVELVKREDFATLLQVCIMENNVAESDVKEKCASVVLCTS